ncbi:MAG TPA: 50S ribosomal protein L13 [Candidatus Bipolaricaulota bacterium]|nr:50S ribosomal protein L13 [Candidatus Bipolaricaulota bacterium]
MAKELVRKIHTLDAEDIALGRLASQIAILLRGKNKTDFQFHEDRGDIVEISNVSKMKFTGKKIEQKKYYHHSGYPGGLKEYGLDDLMKKNPEKVLKNTVLGMLPKNRLRSNMIKRLRFVK